MWCFFGGKRIELKASCASSPPCTPPPLLLIIITQGFFARTYNSFRWKCCILEIRQIEILRFLGILRYKFKLRFWLNLKLYRGIWDSRFGGCSIRVKTVMKYWTLLIAAHQSQRSILFRCNQVYFLPRVRDIQKIEVVISKSRVRHVQRYLHSNTTNCPFNPSVRDLYKTEFRKFWIWVRDIKWHFHAKSA